MNARLVLVTGAEDLLGDRAVDEAIARQREQDPATEVVRLTAGLYESGLLGVHASPSLFGEERVVVVSGLEEAGDELLTDVRAFLDDPAPDVTLVLRHRSGQRGKGVLDAVKAAGAQVVDCAPIKGDKGKLEFVRGEFSRARRRAQPGVAEALVDALGSDLRELASAVAQLVADTDSKTPIDVQLVETYYGGRVEATGFKVADAAVTGRTAEALSLLRHAIAVGVDPVPIVAVLATNLRTLAKVAAAGRSRNSAKELGLAPWQVDKARRQLQGWDPEALGAAITAVAVADEAVKGGGRDPVYAVERAVLAVASSVGRR